MVVPIEDDAYTNEPSHLRVTSDGGEWFIEGVDAEARYTIECWSFDTFAEAVAAMPNFVEATTDDGVVWNWRTRR